jgi:hypothetical protein
MLSLTIENIEAQHQAVLNDSTYGREAQLIHDVLCANPKNVDGNVVAQKIALIDLTNSTQLSRYKDKISLYELVDIILNIKDFDKRVEKGDPELVNCIAECNGKVKLFSFASKYCTYHNVEIYNRDDYSIYDNVVKKALPYYLNDEGITSHPMEKWRRNIDYVAFNECIGQLLDAKNIHIPFRRRKFDHFLWFPNRNRE